MSACCSDYPNCNHEGGIKHIAGTNNEDLFLLTAMAERAFQQIKNPKGNKFTAPKKKRKRK